jgi:HSP20 family molecular chaperone IbpA
MTNASEARNGAAVARERTNGSVERPAFSPRTEIFETNDEVVLVAEMPGVDETTVDVTLEDRVLTISGKTRDVAPEGYRRVYAEFERGDFRRSFELSDEVDAERIEASVKDGILRVRVPKAKPATRRIPVAPGGGA